MLPYYYFCDDANADKKCEKLYALQEQIPVSALSDMESLFDSVIHTVFDIFLLCKGYQADEEGCIYDAQRNPVLSSAAHIVQEQLMSEAALAQIASYENGNGQGCEQKFAAFADVLQEIASTVRENALMLSGDDKPEAMAKTMEQLIPAFRLRMDELAAAAAPVSKLEAYRSMLMKAQTIDACEKVPAFDPDGQHNYLFISYSHKDYKQVYSDIANLRFSGVRVWYDEGLSAGQDWREEVRKHLTDPCCSGVIFYLSENLFTSQSILYEVQLVQGNKPYFSVNLTDRQPSQILKSCISQINSHTDDMEWLHHLSGTFKDSATYLSYSSISHDDNILRQVRKQFNVTIDQPADTKPGNTACAEVPSPTLAKSSPSSKSFLINDGVLGKYIGEDSEVIVPDTVTRISDYAFRDCQNVKVVVLPDTIESIGSHAFDGCHRLTSINLPDSVTNIGSYAFANCTSLASIQIPKGVSHICSYTFCGCSALQSITLPDSASYIGKYAFAGCASLTNIQLPNGISEIAEYVFADCELLEGIVIPGSVSQIGSHAFGGCRSLKGVTVPHPVRIVADCAFADCKSLTGITFPGYLESIGEAAFAGCASLSYIDIAMSALTEIKDHTFRNCSALTQITVNYGVESIGNFAFAGCYSLKSIALPESVTQIGEAAFIGCFKLANVQLPGNVTAIGNGAFAECGLLAEIQLPQGITQIADETFLGCGMLTSIEIPEGVTAIGRMAFGQCLQLREVTIPMSVTAIAGSAFRGSRNVRIRTPKGSYARRFALLHWIRAQCQD